MFRNLIETRVGKGTNAAPLIGTDFHLIPDGEQVRLQHCCKASRKLGTARVAPCWVVSQPLFSRVPSTSCAHAGTQSSAGRWQKLGACTSVEHKVTSAKPEFLAGEGMPHFISSLNRARWCREDKQLIQWFVVTEHEINPITWLSQTYWVPYDSECIYYPAPRPSWMLLASWLQEHGGMLDPGMGSHGGMLPDLWGCSPTYPGNQGTDTATIYGFGVWWQKKKSENEREKHLWTD